MTQPFAQDYGRHLRIGLPAGASSISRRPFQEFGKCMVVTVGSPYAVLHFKNRENYGFEYSMSAVAGAVWPLPFDQFWVSWDIPAGVAASTIELIYPTTEDHVIRFCAVFGTVYSIPSPSQAVKSGHTDLAAGPAVTQLTASDIPCRSVTIKGRVGNVGYLVCGESGLAVADSPRLYAGDSDTIEIANVNLLYINGDHAGDTLEWRTEL